MVLHCLAEHELNFVISRIGVLVVCSFSIIIWELASQFSFRLLLNALHPCQLSVSYSLVLFPGEGMALHKVIPLRECIFSIQS